MKKNPAWLLSCKSDTFSQAGEDGVIGKVKKILLQLKLIREVFI